MHIHSIKIKNFRALEDIYVEFDGKVNVIVGPNAAGKTTVLEAVRLVKALLAPRTQSEATHVIQSLGIASPHMPNQLRIKAIARDDQKPVVIGCHFALGESELKALASAVDTIATSMVESQVGQAFAAPGALISFLSSPQGKQMFESCKEQIQTALTKIQSTKKCYLELTLTSNNGARSTGDANEMQMIAFLERRLPPYKTSFTYFPADRALPAGEQPVQLGGPDAAQQLESYNSQPATKFNRLKNTIFSAAILGEDPASGNSLQTQFESIFNGILKGRKLVSLGVNEIGLLSVLIQDSETGRVFDLDGMSSGEKGLILTFLLIARSVANDGLVLLDEPELHLNPAVCKDLLAYLVAEYVIPRNLQVLICSHSPEILAGAFDNDHCSLYHLMSSSNLTKVRAQDELTLAAALKRLGASESENLLYKGIVFVEGPDDVNLLEAGFPALLRRYKLKFATGRKEVEKAIADLQKAEETIASSASTYFIFDKDDAPTSLASSVSVKVLQWDRRCLENYLIDLDAVSNLLMDKEIVKTPYTNQGEVSQLLRKLAFKQLDEFAAKKVYAKYEFDDVGSRRDDFLNKSLDVISDNLINRIKKVQQQLAAINPETWNLEFKQAVEAERKQLEAIWETNWINDCDGKRLLEDLSKAVQLNLSLKRFKVRLMKEIAVSQSSSWKAVEGYLKTLLVVT
jgi:predicted ATPase